jgi:recombination protein RecA
MSSDELDRFLANARGSAATAKLYSLDELRARRGDVAQSSWGLAALRGRLVELSARGATATLTAAIELVAEAQEQSEPVAWLTLQAGTFYPPDVADSGIDLAALVVVRCPDATAAARAAERCLRSGAFGLVILDLGGHSESRKGDDRDLSIASPHRSAVLRGPAKLDLSMQIQGRLVTLAQTHDAAVVCLTEKTQDTASLGSLVSLRAEALRRRPERPPSTIAATSSTSSIGTSSSSAMNAPEFAVEVRVLKDKRQGPGFTKSLKRRGPAGLT